MLGGGQLTRCRGRGHFSHRRCLPDVPGQTGGSLGRRCVLILYHGLQTMHKALEVLGVVVQVHDHLSGVHAALVSFTGLVEVIHSSPEVLEEDGPVPAGHLSPLVSPCTGAPDPPPSCPSHLL